jgi:hypothetical protein
MDYQFDSYVKVIKTGKISRVVDSEKIFNTDIYYLSDGTSFAECQLNESSHSDFMNSLLNNTSNQRIKEASNVLYENLKPYLNKTEKKKKRFWFF